MEGNPLFLKLDLPYDRVSLEFLESSLLQLGFGRMWTDKTMFCVMTVSFAFIINGRENTYFAAAKGLMQGGLVSPVLFTMVVKILPED